MNGILAWEKRGLSPISLLFPFYFLSLFPFRSRKGFAECLCAASHFAVLYSEEVIRAWPLLLRSNELTKEIEYATNH